MRNILQLVKWTMAGLIPLLMFSSATAQNDSIKQARKDSLVSDKLQKGDKLLAKVDSARSADSIQQASLQQQIAELTSADGRKKAELQARLDSLQAAKAEKQARVKQQVDSLRASTAGIPVLFFDDTLFYIYAKIGPFTATVRAENISKQLTWLVDDKIFRFRSAQGRGWRRKPRCGA